MTARKTKVEWYLCIKYWSDGRYHTKRYKEKTQEKANENAQWYVDVGIISVGATAAQQRTEDVWIERQEIPPAERIEVVADGHED